MQEVQDRDMTLTHRDVAVQGITSEFSTEVLYEL